MLENLGILHLGAEDVSSPTDLGQNIAAHGHLADGGSSGGELPESEVGSHRELIDGIEAGNGALAESEDEPEGKLAGAARP